MIVFKFADDNYHLKQFYESISKLWDENVICILKKIMNNDSVAPMCVIKKNCLHLFFGWTSNKIITINLAILWGDRFELECR